MKRYLSIALLLLLLVSCTKTSNGIGSIYGVVTEMKTAEPMRAAGVSLYVITGTDLYNKPILSLLLKTVTYDDGHFEFNDITQGNYYLTVEMDGYDEVALSITVEAGRTARADMQMSKVDTRITVKTGAPTVKINTVAFKGEYSYYNDDYWPTEYGFVYGNEANPSKEKGIIVAGENNSWVSGNTYSFSCIVKNLKRGTYHARAYAINKLGTTYGEDVSFEMTGTPVVTTLSATNVLDNTATLNGRIEFKGDPVYHEKGFVYSSSFPSPTLDDPESATQRIKVSGVSDDFSANIAGLNKNSNYYVRAYVINADDTIYGESVSFIATSAPYVVIDALSIQKTDISSGTTLSQAVDVCKNSRVGGYSDWHLPTLGELSVLYTNRSTIGGFFDEFYWSNSRGNYYYYAIDFGTGEHKDSSTSHCYRVRCVRSL